MSFINSNDSRETKTRGERKANEVANLNAGNLVFLGFTDRLNYFRKEWSLRFQLVCGELDENGKVKDLIRLPFFVFENREVQEMGTGRTFSHSGSLITGVNQTLRQNFDLKDDVIWADKILPLINKQVYTVAVNKCRAETPSKKAYTFHAYDINKAVRTDGSLVTFDINAHKDDIETLAKSLKFRILCDGFVLNPEAAVTQADVDRLNGKTPAGSTAEPATATGSDVPF